MEKAREHARLNSYAICLSRNSEEDIVNEFSRCIEKIFLSYNLHKANADVTLLVLKAWIKNMIRGRLQKKVSTECFCTLNHVTF